MSTILAMLPPREDTSIPKPVTRRARLEDFFGDDACMQNKNYQNNSHNDSIAKNQQEFGHKKRIKP